MVRLIIPETSTIGFSIFDKYMNNFLQAVCIGLYGHIADLLTDNCNEIIQYPPYRLERGEKVVFLAFLLS